MPNAYPKLGLTLTFTVVTALPPEVCKTVASYVASKCAPTKCWSAGPVTPFRAVDKLRTAVAVMGAMRDTCAGQSSSVESAGRSLAFGKNGYA